MLVKRAARRSAPAPEQLPENEKAGRHTHPASNISHSGAATPRQGHIEFYTNFYIQSRLWWEGWLPLTTDNRNLTTGT